MNKTIQIRGNFYKISNPIFGFKKNISWWYDNGYLAVIFKVKLTL